MCILQIDSVFDTYDAFFNLNEEVKENYSKTVGTSPDGWDACERERWISLIHCTTVTGIYF